MRTGPIAKSSRSSTRLPGCLQRWQRLLLGFYVILFALVLPFICFGAMAEPGHPHRYPHFVFATPVLAASVYHMRAAHLSLEELPTLTGSASTPQSVSQSMSQSMLDQADQQPAHPSTVPMDENALPAENQPMDTSVPGRSTSKLMIFSLLLLLLLGAWRVNPFDLRHIVSVFPPLFPSSLVQPVPIRPPRTVL